MLKIIRSITLLFCFLLFTACSWFADDSEFEPADLISIEDPLPIDEKWSKGAGSGSGDQRLGLAPYIQDKQIYTADYKGELTAIDLATGKKKWQKDFKLSFSGGPGGNDEFLIVGSSNGEVLAVQIETGELVWQKQLSSEILSVPQLSEGIVIIRTTDGKIFALDSRDGHQLWKYEQDVPSLSLRGTSNPVIDKGIVLVGLSNGKLIALNLEDGRLLSEIVVAPPAGSSELDRIADIDGDPILYGGVLYAASYQGKVVAIDGRAGKAIWHRDIATAKNMTVDPEALYLVNKKDEVYALDLDTGSSIWKLTDLLYRQLSAPVVFKEFIVVGDYQGYLHFIDKKTGKIISREHADGDAITAQPLVVNHLLYVLSSDGDLAAFDINP